MTISAHKQIGLLFLLLSVYALIFIGDNLSKDEDWLVASAGNFIRHGSLNIEAIASNEWGSTLYAVDLRRIFGSDNALYTKKGLLSSVALMPWVALADALPMLSAEATALLANPYIIALTAVLLADVGARVGYSERVALLAGGLFGLTTLAVPYAQTAFGEPLVGLLLMAALRLTLAYHRQPCYRLAWWVGLSAGLTVLVNPIYGLLVPIVGLWMLGLNPRRWHWGHGIVFSVPTITALLILGAYNSVRFGGAFTSGYEFSANEGFIHPIYYGAFGLLLSSYRGVLWYSPLMWAALGGWRGLSRQHRGLAWTALALVTVNVLGLASWWSWHGGLVWGPRFMVPVLPLMILFVLPLIHAATTQRAARYGLIGLAAVSAGVQGLGTFYKYVHWPNYLNVQYTGDITNIASGLQDVVMFDPRTSAIWGHALYLLRGGGDVALAWWGASAGVVAAHMAVVVMLAALSALTWRRRISPRWALPIGFAVLLALPALYPPHMTTRAQAIAQVTQPHGVLYAMTSEKWLESVGHNHVISAHAPTLPDHPYARTRWDRALTVAPSRPFWLLTWFGEAHPENWQERYLWTHHAYVSETWIDDNRLLRFDRRPVEAAPTAPQVLGDLTLVASGTARHADGVAVAMVWQSAAPLNTDYQQFVHFLDGAGNIVHQVDRAPLGGYAPTSQWAADAPTTLRFFAPYADAVAVRVGWVHPMTGALLGGEAGEFLVIPVTD